MFVEPGLALRRFATVFEAPVSKPVLRDAARKSMAINTLDNLAATSVAAPPAAAPTVAELLSKIQTAAKAGDPLVTAALPGIIGKSGEATNLQKLYTSTAAGIAPSIGTEVDEALGKAQLATLTTQAKLLSDDHPLTQYLQGVLDRVSGGTTQFAHKVHVLETEEVNAFNAGGSTMVVFTGLLKTLPNEAALAGILGHEMTHGESRHVVKKVIAQSLSNTSSEWVAAAHPVTPLQGNLWSKLTSLVGDVKSATTVVPFKEQNFEALRNIQRAQEAEADAGGITRMASAGYNPHALSSWFVSQEATEAKAAKGLSGLVNAYMDDHPTAVARDAATEAQIKAGGLDAKATDTGADRFMAATADYRVTGIPVAPVVVAAAAPPSSAPTPGPVSSLRRRVS